MEQQQQDQQPEQTKQQQEQQQTKQYHCAYCYIPTPQAKFCGGCKRRAYCSKECSKNDWSETGGGQIHKNWCKVQSGEEDVDYQVCFINKERGLGLKALKKIPKMTRILVEAPRSLTNPAVKQLMPIDGTLEDKLLLNQIKQTKLNKKELCIRISRANHECDSNAYHIEDLEKEVTILYSQKDIEIDEEITINYTLANIFSTYKPPEISRKILQTQWGITCKKDCFCYNNEKLKLIQKGIMIFNKLPTLLNLEQALDGTRQILDIHSQINSSWISIQLTYREGYDIAIHLNKKRIAYDFLKKAIEIELAIYHPESEDGKRWKNIISKDLAVPLMG